MISAQVINELDFRSGHGAGGAVGCAALSIWWHLPSSSGLPTLVLAVIEIFYPNVATVRPRQPQLLLRLFVLAPRLLATAGCAIASAIVWRPLRMLSSIRSSIQETRHQPPPWNRFSSMINLSQNSISWGRCACGWSVSNCQREKYIK